MIVSMEAYLLMPMYLVLAVAAVSSVSKCRPMCQWSVWAVYISFDTCGPHNNSFSSVFSGALGGFPFAPELFY
uniref:Secreted protein n=1 Tax=Arundo donax TaxID=35708 RepID=A0A0A9HGQ9_ARUDO